ncbi:hypothetical protein [Actinophytocola sp.]|uniref:hypothetical protein n=1 Tax=Actinophytocola sp. TaxID=1872138 RepID=UPI002ED4DDDA
MAPPKIDGIPGSMGNYNTNDNMSKFKPEAVVKSQLAEGQAFAAKDGDAKKYLKTFLEKTGDRLRQDTITAKASKQEYLNADWDARDQLLKIAFQPVYVPNKNPDV